MNSIRRMLAPLAVAVAFAASALVPSVALAQGMPDLKDSKHEKAHDTWVERAGSAILHLLGLDTK
jgi:hypothetical protein